MSLVVSWSPFFQSQVRMEGRALQLAGKVRRVEPEDGELVRSVVDADGGPFTVTIHRDNGSAVIQCDSPEFEAGRFDSCAWATVLTLEQEHAAADEDEQAGGDSPANGIDLEALGRLRLKPPKARKRAAAEGEDTAARSNREPDWVGRLSLLRSSTIDRNDPVQNGEAPRDVFPVQRQVCYVVQPGMSRRHGGVVVELQQRAALAGGWSKPKRLRLSAETIRDLPDPIDRELCGMVVGSSRVDDDDAGTFGTAARHDKSHACYRLPVGSRLSLLRRMIDTGRCLLGDEEGIAKGQPLKWGGDEPWTLWLVGSESEDGEELILTMELRRRGRRVPIELPAVLQGGSDGLVIYANAVSPLDDRDAFRWVAQFRDDGHGLAEPKPISVPMSDTPRLLERLYMLPVLPEIDLPEGMGRAERRVEPVPHLELFAGSSPLAQEASAGKGQLAARPWFAYGNHRVEAGAPGRFVSLTAEEAADAGVIGVGEATSGEVFPDQLTPTEAESFDDDALAEHLAAGATAASTAADAASTGDAEDGADDATPATPEADGETDGEATPASVLNPDDEPDPEVRPEPKTDAGVLLRREHRFEREAIDLLARLGLRQPSAAKGNTLLMSSREMPIIVAELIARGWKVSADRGSVRVGSTPKLSIRSGVDWFELHGSVSFDRADGSTQDVPLPEVLAAVRSGRPMVELDDGSQGLLPEQWLEDHRLLTTLGKIEDDHLRFAKPQAAMLDALLEEKELEHADEGFLQTRGRLDRFAGVTQIDPPTEFHGELRPYQKLGLGWMSMLRDLGMGGVLADDMGLGKTIQVLGLLLGRRGGHDATSDSHAATPTAGNGQPRDTPAASPATGDGHRPSLIVVPRSVVFNWIDEAQKFTPELRVEAYTGPERAEVRRRLGELDVVVTSYGLLRRDVNELRHTAFDYVVLDEAQAIKNPNSQAAKACRLLEANHRLALTGTPIENHLGDLWSIFEFLNPGMLGSNSRFAELVRSVGSGGATRPAMSTPAPAAPAQDAAERSEAGGPPATTPSLTPGTTPATATASDAVAQIARAVRPFILRRTKKQVLADLPAKTEQTVICEMNPDQRKVYDELRDYYRNSLLQKVESRPATGDAATGAPARLALGGGSAFMVLEALLRLRQAACHPGLINDDYQHTSSAKLEALEAMLDDIVEEGGKALVFSQFTSMLGLVRQRLDAKGIRYAYLDGRTRNRKQIVESFQNDDDLHVFLISLKAGGLGLNLTAAEYVFLLDPWWNPAVEAQAIDRTHRIGQTKPVFAYRMICEDTVEQRVLELQQAKRELAESVVTADENVLRSLTKGDLERLLS